MAVLITGGPQVDGPLRVLDSEARRFQGRSQYGPPPEIPLPLLLHMIMIIEQLDHHLLHRTRNQHPCVLADQEQICHHISIAGNETRPVARHVRAFGERVDSEQPVVSTTVDRRMQHRDRLRLPTELPVALIRRNQCATLTSPGHPILERIKIEDLASRIGR